MYDIFRDENKDDEDNNRYKEKVYTSKKKSYKAKDIVEIKKYYINNISTIELKEVIETYHYKSNCEVCNKLKVCMQYDNKPYQSIKSEYKGLEQVTLELITEVNEIKMQSLYYEVCAYVNQNKNDIEKKCEEDHVNAL